MVLFSGRLRGFLFIYLFIYFFFFWGGGLIIGGNFAFQNGLGMTIKTALNTKITILIFRLSGSAVF